MKLGLNSTAHRHIPYLRGHFEVAPTTPARPMASGTNVLGPGTSARNGDIGTSRGVDQGKVGRRDAGLDGGGKAHGTPAAGHEPVFGGGQTGSAWGLIRAWTIFPSSVGA